MGEERESCASEKRCRALNFAPAAPPSEALARSRLPYTRRMSRLKTSHRSSSAAEPAPAAPAAPG